ncbi:alpha/beta-hydrolase [Schizopora paradoxa]|uniref:Alpha/beta-hydrolase n=1 Tax=Schizopora paradoxa TaxID=27342 RepID=A0A0H2R6U6_9AGAM|nr:alpha/beta-hydrolase [Schizopora paradoxa]
MTSDSKLVASSDGTKIYADSNGNSSKPALVFIHGFMLSAGVFDCLFADEKFTSEFHLIRYDLRGQGRSGQPKSAEGHVSKLYADDFAAVCDAFGSKKPYMVGWSYGCTVFADIAAHLPHDYLSGAIFICGPPYLGAVLEGIVTPDLATILPNLVSDTAPGAEHESAVSAFAGLLFTDTENVPWDIKWSWRGMGAIPPPSSFGFALVREIDAGPLIALGRKGFPLHVIGATDDGMINAQGVLAEVGKYFVKLTSFVVEKGSHAVFYQSRDVVVESITSYLFDYFSLPTVFE